VSLKLWLGEDGITERQLQKQASNCSRRSYKFQTTLNCMAA